MGQCAHSYNSSWIVLSLQTEEKISVTRIYVYLCMCVCGLCSYICLLVCICGLFVYVWGILLSKWDGVLKAWILMCWWLDKPKGINSIVETKAFGMLILNGFHLCSGNKHTVECIYGSPALHSALDPVHCGSQCLQLVERRIHSSKGLSHHACFLVLYGVSGSRSICTWSSGIGNSVNWWQ